MFAMKYLKSWIFYFKVRNWSIDYCRPAINRTLGVNGLIAKNDTLFGTATSPAKLFAFGQSIRNCNFTLTIGNGSQKKDYDP